MVEPSFDQILDAEIKKSALLKSEHDKTADDTVKIIEAFASDKAKLDEKRPGMFNRHSLFGDIDKNERYAQIYAMRAGELFRSIYRASYGNTKEKVIESNETISAYIGFSSRSKFGKERAYLAKTITEVITNKSDDHKKGGIGRWVPFRGGKR